ncbi:MAG: hypothetical protein Q4F67_07860 [Propionibacteriaceae bacterium]|nr:hypothetical protein [Propionibacteriaceae bacterium]
MTLSRRSLVLGTLGASVLALTGCIGNRRQAAEDWLRSRSWVAVVERVEARGGPVPLPGPADLTARVRCVPGTDRLALTGIRAEIEDYAATHARDVRTLLVHLEHDSGLLPVSGNRATNDEVFALHDLAVADSRAERVEIEWRTGLELRVTTPATAVLAYAEELTSKDPGTARATIVVRDAEATSVVTTGFGQTERVRTVAAAVAAAGRARGFEAHSVTDPIRLTVELDSRDLLDPTFRALRRRWPEAELDLTVEADRLGLRGPESVTERLPGATDLFAAAPFSRLVVQDHNETVGRVTLVARVDDPTTVAAATRAIGDHAEAGGVAVWFLLDPIAKVRLLGSPALVAACGGPAQAVVTGASEQASADNTQGRLRLYPNVPASDFESRGRAIRAAGWPGALDFEVNGGSFTVAYRSTATGRAQNVEVVKTIGTIDGSSAWITAWDASATE